jgi:hypothetical protein
LIKQAAQATATRDGGRFWCRRPPVKARKRRTRVIDQEPPSKAISFTKEDAIAILWKIAATAPESTRGNLRDQIRACKLMYRLGYEPALNRLSELADIDAARTKGHRRGQESAERLLKRSVSSIKVDKNQGIQ